MAANWAKLFYNNPLPNQNRSFFNFKTASQPFSRVPRIANMEPRYTESTTRCPRSRQPRQTKENNQVQGKKYLSPPTTYRPIYVPHATRLKSVQPQEQKIRQQQPQPVYGAQREKLYFAVKPLKTAASQCSKQSGTKAERHPFYGYTNPQQHQANKLNQENINVNLTNLKSLQQMQTKTVQSLANSTIDQIRVEQSLIMINFFSPEDEIPHQALSLNKMARSVQGPDPLDSEDQMA